jgi:hypothetical protein
MGRQPTAVPTPRTGWCCSTSEDVPMQMHMDVKVRTVEDLDPAGHPFCLPVQ